MPRHPDSPTRAGPAWPRAPGWTSWEIVLLGAILLVAVLLRTISLDQVPPGMQHDEVFDARFATYILNGARPVFIDENTGVPPLFMYLVAGAFKLLGRNLIALRLTSVIVGMLGLAVNYLLLRGLLGRAVALLTLAGLSVSFWHLFDSRIGIEPIIVPLMTGLSFYLFWQGMRRGSLIWYAAAGVSLGLTLYSHHTGVLVLATILLFALYLVLSRHPWLRGEDGAAPGARVAAGLTIMFLIALIVTTPMILHIAGNPGDSMLRVRQLNHHMTALAAGDPGPLLGDLAGLLGMFGFSGDPEWRYNVAGRPIFDLATAACFWAGVAICLTRIRKPAYLFLLIWLPVNLIMAAIAPPVPTSTRALGSIVPIYAMPAVAWVSAWQWANGRQRKSASGAIIAIVALLLAGNAAWTIRDYFWIWPQNSEVRAIYRADLATAARYLDDAQPEGAVCLSARFAADLDRQIFDYMLRSERPIKWFDAGRTLVIPSTDRQEPVHYLFPATDPVTPHSRRLLTSAGASVTPIRNAWGLVDVEAFQVTASQLEELRDLANQQAAQTLGVNLGDEIDVLGYELPARVRAGEPIGLTVNWRVRRGGRGGVSYAFFAHVRDERGFRWTQDDPTGFPPNSWWADDLVIQTFDLVMPIDAPPGAYTIDLGFYEQQSGRRFAEVLADDRSGADTFSLGPFDVTPAWRPPGPGELSITEPLSEDFGGRIRLLGYSMNERILNLEDRVEIALFWEKMAGDAAGDVETELTLVDESGKSLPSIRRRLMGGLNPLDTWVDGQILRDRFHLTHSADIPRAIYDLELSVRDAETGAYLLLAGGRQWVSLGQVFMRGLPE